MISTLHLYPNNDYKKRLFALWYFTILFILFVILGIGYLGFEQSWAHPVVGVGTACIMHFLLEFFSSWSEQRNPRYFGGILIFLNFSLPAVITGLAISILIYTNERLWPVAFAAAFAISSKILFRIPINPGTQHVFNPSNIGIIAVLILFPSIGIAPPYHYTENIQVWGDWILPIIVFISGFFIHWLFVKRFPLVFSWLLGFIIQAGIRSAISGEPIEVFLVPMTSVAFVLFTLYMIPDPATTPLKTIGQVYFGLSTATVYGFLQYFNIVYGLFASLFIICFLRWAYFLAISYVWQTLSTRILKQITLKLKYTR